MGSKFKAWQPGGAGTDSRNRSAPGLPDGIPAIQAGSRLAMALAMAVDQDITVSLVRNLEEFLP